MEGLLLMLDGIAMILVVIWTRQAMSRRTGTPLKGLFRYPEYDRATTESTTRRRHPHLDRTARS